MEIIHIVLGKANPERMNGVNKVVNELAIRQKLVGLSVSLWGITKQLDHNYPDRIYETKLFSAQKNPFAISKVLKEAILNLNKDTVCHLHGGFVPTMYAVAKYLRKNNIKFVFTPHGSYNLIAMQKNGLIKAMYYRLFESKLLNTAYKIHVLGESELNGLYTILPDINAKLIPYGFQLNTTDFKSSNSNNRFIVGYCGRLDVYTKGLAELLEGFKQFFLKRDATAQLWLIGDGNQKKYLMKLASKLGIANAVVFHGAKFGIEKFELLMRFNLFAAPSRNEGLPTAVLEAAALGIPCLVTKATNMGSYISSFDAGMVISNTLSEEINEGISSLYYQLKNKERAKQLSENARNMVSTAFNWDLIVQQFAKLYQ